MLKQLLEEKGRCQAEIKRLADLIAAEKRDFTADEKGAWEKVNADYDKACERIGIAERAAQVGAAPVEAPEKRKVESPEAEEPSAGEQLRQWFQGGRGEFELRLGNTASVMEARREARDLSKATSNVAITNQFLPSFERAMLAFGTVRNLAQIIRTDRGDTFYYPTINDTGNSAAVLAEATSISTSVDPTFAYITMEAYKLSSGVVLVSPELLQDSAYNLEQAIGSMIGERLARGQNAYLTTGTGSGQPNGIVYGATSGVTTASASAITADELMDLVYSVDASYRPGSVWMMRDATIKVLRKLKDGDGQYIWQPGLMAGQPDMLLGYPLVPNQAVAAIGASAKAIMFGDPKKYLVREVANVRFRKLEERYADTDQIAFIAFMRTDADILDAGTHPIKCLTMHS